MKVKITRKTRFQRKSYEVGDFYDGPDGQALINAGRGEQVKPGPKPKAKDDE